MKAVMISIQPKWCDLIASGKKTIEVRKTRPKIDTPFKCYIYCSKSKPYLYKNPNNNELFLDKDLYRGGVYEDRFLSGKVIGEFVCHRIEDISYTEVLTESGAFVRSYYYLQHGSKSLKKTCLTMQEIKKYLNGKYGYGWHISDLNIYDEPKELRDFEHPCPKRAQIIGDCRVCKYLGFVSSYRVLNCQCEVTKPPQSWCFVEEMQSNSKR